MIEDDNFIDFSNECINKIVDFIGTVESKSDLRKFNDMYQHMFQLQRRCIVTGDAQSIEQFKREWKIREPVITGHSYEEEDDDYGEEPSQQQLEEFKKTVDAWFQIDDEEKALKKQVAERSLLKKKLTATIVSFMDRYSIDDLNAKDGKLRMFKKQVKKLPSKSVQLQRIEEFFSGQEEEVQRFNSIVFEAKQEERCGIRRLKASSK
ncbi:hypothetical protein TetV_040 [Tetraselmis virus 1]|uniref:Uncharacterized protein n=1 Tax=Tetraselmis virus 1 TaxID=2060617 RepID=A0A2P0VML9_9VIRU|nr:hypothetical protein QJ968_gp040 [Tetraselmis virus 1]AUF82132.1 hypothetical protein TetV_040 [Tetraselmis virus 1]